MRLRKLLKVLPDITLFKPSGFPKRIQEIVQGIALRQRSVAVFGRNAEAEFLISNKFATVLADDRDPNGLYAGARTSRLSDLSRDSILVNCSTSVSPIDVQRFITGATDASVIHYSALCFYYPELFKLPDFVTSFRSEYDSNLDFYCSFYSLLSDDLSRQTFLNFLRYRYHFDLNAMKNYSVRLKDQYFEDFIDLNGLGIVDGGGFDGDTAQEIVERFPHYREIFFLSPRQLIWLGLRPGSGVSTELFITRWHCPTLPAIWHLIPGPALPVQ